MAKATLKTKETKSSVAGFLNSIADEQARSDSKSIIGMMEKATGDKPKMWGSNIVGFGNVQLKYESGRELDWFKIGFSPRKQNLTLYGVLNKVKEPALLEKLGKYSTGKGCLYIKKLADVNPAILKKIIESSSKGN